MTDGYTTEDRKSLVTAFRWAKRFLWNGRILHNGESMICLAIAEAASRGHISTSTSFLATELIAERLGKCGTIRSWLVENGVSRHDLTDERVQAHRHAWLDLLIAEFSAPEAS